MYVINLTVEPKPDTEQAHDTGGAYAVCWIDFALQDGAEQLARYYADRFGWIPRKINSSDFVDASFYDEEFEGEERDELKRYYAEAEEDGVCIVTYEWPPDAEDAQVDDD